MSIKVNENKNEELEVVEVQNEESKAKNFISKVGEGAKKHGKKVLFGLGAVALAAGAYFLGRGANSDDCEDCEETDELDVIDAEYSEITSEEN